MRGVGGFGRVELVDTFKAEAVVHGLPGLGAAALARAVVHEGDAGMDGAEEGSGVGLVEAVMADQIEIDGRQRRIRADKGQLFGASKVAEVEKTEVAEGEEDAGGTRVLRRIFGP